MTISYDPQKLKATLEKAEHKLKDSSLVSPNTLYEYEYLEGWLRSGDDTPWVSQLEDVIGLFGDHDELIDYYEMFKSQYPLAYRIHSDHRPKAEEYTENIKTPAPT